MNSPIELSSSKRPIYGGVLIGGASRRMGRPKSLLALAGETFLEHVVGAVRGCVDRLLLLGDGPIPPAAQTLIRLPDVPSVTGPLAGILAAMRYEPAACWVISACDLPRLRKEAVDWLLAQRRAEHWAILPCVLPGRVEPLLAVYEPEALELLERRAKRGVRAPSDLAREPRVYSPRPPTALRDSWENVNTRGEFLRLRGDVEERSRQARGHRE